jgi:D-inositol-3-phosphate glycosyltransferase
MVRVVHLPAGGPETPLDQLFDSLPEFRQRVLEFAAVNGLTYQAVHSHYWLSGWIGQHLGAIWRVPRVITFHTLGLIKLQSRAGEAEPVRRQETERDLMASATRIIAYSPHERDSMVRLYGADPGKILLIPCGVDLQMFRPLDQHTVRDRLGLDGEKVLLFVGRIEPLKGLELLIHATAQMDTCQPLRVLVVGGGLEHDPEVERMRELARRLEISEIVDFIGRVDHEELPVYYNAADVCVVPSFYESFGLAALESMACGTPVVATRVGGLSTIVQHGHTGYLKSWRCPEAFAGSLEMIISNRRLQQSMGHAARRRAEGMSWDAVAARVAEVYESYLPTPPR